MAASDHTRQPGSRDTAPPWDSLQSPSTSAAGLPSLSGALLTVLLLLVAALSPPRAVPALSVPARGAAGS